MTVLFCIPAALLLLYAALHDLVARTVPNWLSGALLALGLALRLHDHTLWLAAAVAACTFVVLFLAWLAGLVGGGDVKLWAAAALLIPPLLPQELDFFLRVVIGGGILAAIYLILRLLVCKPRAPLVRKSRAGGLMARLLRVEVWRIRRRAPLPYACAIAAGAMLTFLPFCFSVR